jgi:hypothetical protein
MEIMEYLPFSVWREKILQANKKFIELFTIKEFETRAEQHMIRFLDSIGIFKINEKTIKYANNNITKDFVFNIGRAWGSQIAEQMAIIDILASFISKKKYMHDKNTMVGFGAISFSRSIGLRDVIMNKKLLSAEICVFVPLKH